MARNHSVKFVCKSSCLLKPKKINKIVKPNQKKPLSLFMFATLALGGYANIGGTRNFSSYGNSTSIGVGVGGASLGVAF